MRLKMNWGKFSLWALLAANAYMLAAAEKTFELDVSKGLTASFSKGKAEPLKIGNVAERPGIDGGKAVHIPKKDGFLLYSLKDNFPAKRGTILLWLKPDWTSEGVRHWDSAFRGIFSTAEGGNSPGPSKLSYGNQLGAAQYGVVHFHWGGEQQNLVCWESRRLYPAGIWQCYAFTYDASGKGLGYYLNGQFLHSTNKNMPRSLGSADSFYVGSANFHGNNRTGYEGSLARVEIYNDILTLEELRKISYQYLPGALEVKLADPVSFPAKTPVKRNFVCTNHADIPVARELKFIATFGEGAVTANETRKLELAPGESRTETFQFQYPAAGEGTFELSVDGTPVSRIMVYAIDPVPLRDSMPLSADGKTKEKLIATIDCSQEYGADTFRDDGATKAVRSSLGAWREAFSGKKLCGFIYRFMSIPNPDRPHWLEIEYPDNAQRQFYVAAFQEKNGKTLVNDGNLDTIGVLTGGMHPVTNTMQKKRLLFWPSTPNLTVGCFAHAFYEGDQGPALAKISLYEIEELPQLKLNLPEKSRQRQIGVWQEDPYMPMAIWFNRTDGANQNRAFWSEKWDRMAQYLLYTGQNLCPMPVFSYLGDACETESYMSGWDELGAQILEREKLGFVATIQDMGICSHPAVAGAGGIARRIGLEKLSWTVEEALARGENSLERFVNDNHWSASGNGRNYPRLNPLHPVVQEAYASVITEYARKFAPYESFKGLTFILADSWSSVFYRDLSEGYEDWTIRQFEKDTKIRVPVPSDARDRFAKRYQWLMKNAKNQWIRWRVERLSAFYKKMVAALQREAPGRLISFVTRISEEDFVNYPENRDLKQVWLERGVDFEKISAISGLHFPAPAVRPNVERAGINTPVREKGTLRNARFYSFSPELAELKSRSAALIHASNLETYSGYASEQVKSYFLPRDSEGTPVTNHRSFATPLPNNLFAPEYLIRLIADFDPALVLNGWWGNPDNGTIDTFLPVYRTFRAIPDIPFAKIPGISDPVQARYAADNDLAYLMLVNRESYPVKLELAFDQPLQSLRDIADEKKITLENGNRLVYTMKPYELLCLTNEKPFAVKQANIIIPVEIVAGLQKQIDFLEQCIAVLPKEKSKADKLPFFLAEAKKAMAQKAYSRLHYLFDCQPVSTYMKKLAGEPLTAGEIKLLPDAAGKPQLTLLLHNETPQLLNATLQAKLEGAGTGMPIRITLPPLSKKIADLPLAGSVKPFSATDVEISVKTTEKSFTISRRVLTPITVENGKWTEEFPIGKKRATFALKLEDDVLLVRTKAKDGLRIHGPQLWTSACIEIYTDFDPRFGMASAKPQLFHSKCQQLGIPGYTSGKVQPVLLRSGKSVDPGKITAEVSDLPGGYETLTRIPLREELNDSVAGKNIALAVAVDWIDGGGTRCAAGTASNEYWRSRAEFTPVHFAKDVR